MNKVHRLIVRVAVLALIVLVIVLWPRADGVGRWREDLMYTANASLDTTKEGARMTLNHVRDWTYAPGVVVTREWKDVSIHTKDIVRTWLYLEPFPSWKEVGHTFLAFEMQDGSTIAFSIEARVEAHDTYSALRGMFGAYELALQWGEERDFVGRRILKQGADLYRYPLSLSPTDSAKLFIALANETHTVAGTPRLYNTLTENCTNIFARVINDYAPGALPLDLSWYLTGNADEYLMREGYIVTDGKSVTEMREIHNLRNHYEAIRAAATSTPKEFAEVLRGL